MSAATSMQGRINEKAQNAPARVVHRFTIPVTMRGNNDVESIGIVELTTDEELRATKRSGNEAARLAYELTKQSLVQINDKDVNEADGSRDKAWSTMHPKIRSLLLQAYTDLHAPEKDEVEAFLKSHQASVG